MASIERQSINNSQFNAAQWRYFSDRLVDTPSLLRSWNILNQNPNDKISLQFFRSALGEAQFRQSAPEEYSSALTAAKKSYRADFLYSLFQWQQETHLLKVWEKIWEKIADASPGIAPVYKEDDNRGTKCESIRKWLNDPKNQRFIRSVNELKLNGLELMTLPLELSQFTGLTSLDLSFNSLQEIPLWLTQLPYLKALDIRNALKPV